MLMERLELQITVQFDFSLLMFLEVPWRSSIPDGKNSFSSAEELILKNKRVMLSFTQSPGDIIIKKVRLQN